MASTLSLDTSQDVPKLGQPKLLSTLAKTSKANKGREGLAILPGSATLDKKAALPEISKFLKKQPKLQTYWGAISS